jgi:hypothetical protein
MPIRQARIRPLNSPAGPLPTGATGTRFPLSAGSARCIQEADFNQIFDAGPAILECVNGIFPLPAAEMRAARPWSEP